MKKDVIHAIAGSTLPALLPVGEGTHTYLYRPDLNPHMKLRLDGKYLLLSWLPIYLSLLCFSLAIESNSTRVHPTRAYRSIENPNKGRPRIGFERMVGCILVIYDNHPSRLPEPTLINELAVGTGKKRI